MVPILTSPDADVLPRSELCKADIHTSWGKLESVSLMALIISLGKLHGLNKPLFWGSFGIRLSQGCKGLWDSFRNRLWKCAIHISALLSSSSPGFLGGQVKTWWQEAETGPHLPICPVMS